MVYSIVIYKGKNSSFLPYSHNQVTEYAFHVDYLNYLSRTTPLPSWTIIEIDHSMEEETGPCRWT